MWYVYRIFYKNDIVYVGRTNDLTRRMSQHFRSLDIDIDKVSKIEYAELETESDMNLYELYYILKYKPSLNRKDFAKDTLTIQLDDLQFTQFYSHLEQQWREAAHKKKEKLIEKQSKLETLKQIVKEDKIELKSLAKEQYLNLYGEQNEV